MQKNKSLKDLGNLMRQSFDSLKTKEIIDESKGEVNLFFGQTSEKITHLLLSVNEKFEIDLKQRLIDLYGREFG